MVKLIIGDLFQCKSDIIVAPIKDDMELEGSISGNITKLLGKEVQTQLKFYKSPKLSECVPLYTLGKIQAKVILLVFNPWWNKDQHSETLLNLKKSYLNCIHFAYKNNFKSITFPALSTGKFYNLPLAKSVNCFLEACEESGHQKELDISFCVLKETFDKNHTMLRDCLGDPFNDETDLGFSACDDLPKRRIRDFSNKNLPKKCIQNFADILKEMMTKYGVRSKEKLCDGVCTVGSLNKYLCGSMTPKTRDIVITLAIKMGATLEDTNRMLIGFTQLDEDNSLRDQIIVNAICKEKFLSGLNKELIANKLNPLTK